MHCRKLRANVSSQHLSYALLCNVKDVHMCSHFASANDASLYPISPHTDSLYNASFDNLDTISVAMLCTIEYARSLEV